MGIKFDIRSVGIFDVVSARLSDGEVFDSAKLKNTIRFLIENDMRNIVIDLGSLEYLYSDTINAFIASNRHMLEVSGRIAILTEHPKVQDILKRAGLDNIMRIYRSEAEMVADSKEILRQTSSYRIDELAKVQNQPGLPPGGIPQEIVEPTPPKTEFDDFRNEIGLRLGTKLENNEVPQYQYGTPPTTFNPPVAPPPPTAPTFGGYANPTPPAMFGYPPAAPESTPAANTHQHPGSYPPPAPVYPNQGYPVSNFDFPTVQMPAGGYSAPPPPIAPLETSAGDPEGFDPRGRKESPDRLRSPSARKAQSRRVGGRGEFEARESDREDQHPEPLALEPVVSEPKHEYQKESVPPQSISPLLDKRSSFAPVILGLIFLLLLGGGAFFYFSRQNHPPQQSALQPPPQAVAVAPATAPPESTVKAVATPAPTPPPAPATPASPAPVQAKATPTPPPVEKVAPKPKVEAPRPKIAEHPRTRKIAPGHLEITSNPPGADVLVNFARKGVTPLVVDLLNNANRIIVKLNGYKRYETTVNRNTKNRELNIDLESDGSAPSAAPPTPAPAPQPETASEKSTPSPAPSEQPAPAVETQTPPPATPAATAEVPAPTPSESAEPTAPAASGFTPGSGPEGIVFLSSTPARADIYVDGKPINEKTPYKLSIPSGTHHIEMSKDGLKASVTQNVNAGRNKALLLMLQ